MSGVGIICFASSYAVALALEFSRLFFRSGVRGAFMVGFGAAGLVAHTIFLYHRAMATPGSPLSSTRDWCLLAAWLLVVIYLYLTCYHPQKAFGAFLLPLVLALIAVAAFVASPEPFARGPSSQVWGIVHGVSILLASVALLVGFVAGIMYLEQTRRLKNKRTPMRGLRLPSLEWLARANSRAVVISTLLLGVGLLSGEILRMLGGDDRVPWHDPVVLSTFCMFGCLLAASLAGVFYRPTRAGRKVAYLTVASFLVLLVAMSTIFSVGTQHGGRQTKLESSHARDAS